MVGVSGPMWTEDRWDRISFEEDNWVEMSGKTGGIPPIGLDRIT